MPRPSIYPADDILDAAAQLVSADGPAGLSVTRIAARLGAPSGSIYHRFRSRDVLAASLWLRTVERFQAGWVAATDHEDAHHAVRQAAKYVVGWSRGNPIEARLLLMYRSRDLLAADWPPELKERNRDQRARIDDALNDLARRFGASTPADRRRLRFAILDIPYGAVRGPLTRGQAPETELDQLVDDAVVGVIGRIKSRRPT